MSGGRALASCTSAWRTLKRGTVPASAILLVFDLLLQQRHVLLLGDDQGAIEDDLVKLVDDLRDNVVDRRAEAEKRAVVSCVPL